MNSSKPPPFKLREYSPITASQGTPQRCTKTYTTVVYLDTLRVHHFRVHRVRIHHFRVHRVRVHHFRVHHLRVHHFRIHRFRVHRVRIHHFRVHRVRIHHFRVHRVRIHHFRVQRVRLHSVIPSSSRPLITAPGAPHDTARYCGHGMDCHTVWAPLPPSPLRIPDVNMMGVRYERWQEHQT